MTRRSLSGRLAATAISAAGAMISVFLLLQVYPQDIARGQPKAPAILPASPLKSDSDPVLVLTEAVATREVTQSQTQAPTGPTQGGLLFQDFEGTEEVGWPGSNCTARLTTGNEPKYSGNYAWRTDCGDYWNYVYVRARNGSWDVDALRENNDRLVFWIYALPLTATDNTVAVRFYDHGNYSTAGFEVWSTQTAHYGEWTKISILFDQLPADFDLRHINKLEFKNYLPGTYYLDDIQFVREDRIYQTFEPSYRSLNVTNSAEFGWVWGVPSNTVELSTDRVHEGDYAWKLVLHDYWSGTGLKSAQKYLSPRTAAGEQSFWHVSLDPEFNDRLTFWIYALPLNGLDNNINVQFFDHLTHTIKVTETVVDRDHIDYWTNQAAHYGQWTQIDVPFAAITRSLALTSTPFNLHDLDKIQIQMYWPGTYYLDDLEATSSAPTWDRSLLKGGVLQWKSSYPLNRYVLQENTVSGDPAASGWVTVYAGTNITYPIPRITSTWYRIRAEELPGPHNEVPFQSAWSESLAYEAPLVVLDYAELTQHARLKWTQLPNATSYEVMSATELAGPWSSIYTGPYPALPLSSGEDTWYRVRALSSSEATPWSTPLRKSSVPQAEFLHACGTKLCSGNVTTTMRSLQGINLGSYFLVEPWMNEWPITDDYSLREVLSARFTITDRDHLIQIYRDTWLQEADFDQLKRMGIQFIRLPLYYIDFPTATAKIDWIVNACASRGMYVLLDLHGAPGSQSEYMHTGRINYNRLFSNTQEGVDFRDQTTQLWSDIAAHYKDNPMVLGYDLLNEPTGAPELTQLWDFYDRLYNAIRMTDTRHIIMMEGVWDWDTLPNPNAYGWQNVVYQFHYYCPDTICDPESDYDTYVNAHRQFIDGKITTSLQITYQVPAMIGEFNAFDSRAAWEYYVAKFVEQDWSWAVWSYKVSSPNSRWGLLTDQEHSQADIPIFPTDDYLTLEYKMSQPFDTLRRYVLNETLVELLRTARLIYKIHLPVLRK